MVSDEGRGKKKWPISGDLAQKTQIMNGMSVRERQSDSGHEGCMPRITFEIVQVRIDIPKKQVCGTLLVRQL